MARKKRKLKRVGTAGAAAGRLPRILPSPAQRPQIIIDPAYTGGTGNYLTEHVIRSDEPLDRYSRAHEMFHTLDYDQLSAQDRMALARIIAPRRAAESETDWWGETGEGAGAHAGLAEVAADYYAAAKTGLKLKPRRRAGMKVADQHFAYEAGMRPKRLGEFREFLDQWTRDRMIVPVAPARKRVRKRG